MNKFRIAVLVWLCWIGNSADLAYGQASIQGVVALPKTSGQAPPRIRYPNQVIQPGPAEPTMAVVYLEGDFASRPRPEKQAGVEMGQKQLQFAPGLLPIQTGTTVTFPNYDEIYHNVFSYSKTKRFDLGRYQKNEGPPAMQFDRPGVVKLYCEIHEHMRGTILVLDSPYYTKTDTNGSYQLSGLPAGQFTLKAWLDEKTVLSQMVNLQSDSRLQLNFTRANK